MAPIDVNKDNEAMVWDKMYNDAPFVKRKDTEKSSKNKRFRKKKVFKFEIDDYVRLPYTKYVFQRDYQQKWTTELFKISERFLNDPVIGNWYEWELLKADKDQEFWRVESILKTRIKKVKKEYLVKWEGYGDKFSSWVLASDVKDMSAYKHQWIRLSERDNCGKTEG